eukprot:GHVT01062249.1.p1 GENE.GHVT01062249.1~~GHVT01062249.1.p1  ORF type:complete len:559 (+),score=147.48 GHVT01062249.1:3632-5308(+)
MARLSSGCFSCAQVERDLEARGMRERLERLEKENRALTASSATALESLRAQENAHALVVAALQRKVADCEGVIIAKTSALGALQEQKSQMLKTHHDSSSSQQTLWQSQIAKMQKHEEQQADKIKAAEEFLLQRQVLETRMEQLEKDMLLSQQAHQDDISALERQHAVSCERMRLAAAENCEEREAALRTALGSQASDVTLKLQEENRNIKDQLAFQSTETEKLLLLNGRLQAENLRLSRDVELNRDVEKSLAHKAESFRLRALKLQASLSPRGRSPPADGPAAGADSTGSEPKVSSKNGGEERAAEWQLRVLGLTQAYNALKLQFDRYRGDHQTLVMLQDEAVRLLIGSLYDVRKSAKISGARGAGPLEDGSAAASGVRPKASVDFRGEGVSEIPSEAAEGNEEQTLRWTGMSTRDRAAFLQILLSKLNAALCHTCTDAEATDEDTHEATRHANGSLQTHGYDAEHENSQQDDDDHKDDIQHQIAARLMARLQESRSFFRRPRQPPPGRREQADASVRTTLGRSSSLAAYLEKGRPRARLSSSTASLSPRIRQPGAAR